MPEGDLKPGAALEAAPEKAPMSFGDSSFDSIVKQAVTGLQADSAETRQTLKANAGRTNDILTRLEASDKDKPKLPEIAPPEKPAQAPTPMSAYEQFGSAASVLATLGALATRRPLVAALNASAGAMKAMQTRDSEAFKQNLETWKANSEYAGKYAQWQLDRYKSALENHKGTQESLFGQLRAIASIDQDAVAQHAMQTGDLQVVEKFMADRQSQIERYSDHQLKLAEFGERQKHDLTMENSPERDAYFAARKLHPDKDPAEILRDLKQPRSPSAPESILEDARKQWKAAHNGQDMPYEEQAKVLQSTHTSASSEAKKEAVLKQTDSLLSQADDLLTMIDKNPSIVGTRGKVGGAVETIKGLLNPRAATDPAFQKFETAMKAFRTEASLAISQSKYYSGARMAEMAKTLPALENFTSAQDATAALTTMRSLLQGAKLEVGEAQHDLGAITQADLEATARANDLPIDVVKRMLHEKGFDVP